MVGIIACGGKQYVVGVGQKLRVEKLQAKDGEVLTYDDLLHPSKKIKARYLTQARGPKINILKFKNKTRYIKRRGSRQPYSIIEVIDDNTQINADKKTRIIADKKITQRPVKKPVVNTKARSNG